jgi:hypothetical protein
MCPQSSTSPHQSPANPFSYMRSSNGFCWFDTKDRLDISPPLLDGFDFSMMGIFIADDELGSLWHFLKMKKITRNAILQLMPNLKNDH